MATFHFTKEAEGALFELYKIHSQYEDLLKLMDSDIPERTFLELLNDRFQRFLLGLGDPCALDRGGDGQGGA